MKRVPADCWFLRNDQQIPLHRLVWEKGDGDRCPPHYDPHDVCWTRRLYFHPLTLKDLLLSLLKEMERFLRSVSHFQIESTNSCAAGHLFLGEATELVAGVKRACQEDDPVFIQLYFLYFYAYFPPARRVLMSQAMHEAVAFLADAYLRQRFAILFTTGIYSREIIGVWVAATLSPLALRHLHIMVWGTPRELEDWMFLAEIADYGLLDRPPEFFGPSTGVAVDGGNDAVPQAVFECRNFKEWSSFQLANRSPKHFSFAFKLAEARHGAGELCKNPKTTGVVFPLAYNVTAATAPLKIPVTSALQCLFTYHAYSYRKEEFFGGGGGCDEEEGEEAGEEEEDENNGGEGVEGEEEGEDSGVESADEEF